MSPLDLRVADLAPTLAAATGLPLAGREPQHVKLPTRTACIQRLALRLEGDTVLLNAWPAELQPQARAFYGDRSRVERVLDLTAADAWSAHPNGHLSYWLAAPERRWYWAGGSLDTAEYMRRWRQDLSEVHAYRREDVPAELWPWLVRRGYVGDGDRGRMEAFLARVPRPHVHLRPGVRISRRWSLADARRAHERGELVREVREAVAVVLGTLGESPLAR